MVLGREVRLPKGLAHLETLDGEDIATQYAAELKERIEQIGDQLRHQQITVRMADAEEFNLYAVGDSVWLRSYFKKQGNCVSCCQNP